MPTLTISSSGGLTNLHGNDVITATISGLPGGASVDKVEFYLDIRTAPQHTDQTAPYNWTWDTTAVSDSTHEVYAKAYYSKNKVVSSNHLYVTVKNAVTPPPPPLCQDPPASTALPLISGTATEGQTLRVSDGGWTNCAGLDVDGCSCTYTYQWLRCDASGNNPVAIPDQTNSYVLASIDVGNTIRCAVTARNSPGPSMAATSAQTAVVQALVPAVPVNTTKPGPINGTPALGNALSCSTGQWSNSPTDYAYQWQRCDSAGANPVSIGTNVNNYTLVGADVGHTIRCRVTASNGAGAGTGVQSNPTSLVTTSGPVAPVFDGRASLVSSITYSSPTAGGVMSPAVYANPIGAIESDGSTGDITLVSDARYGKAFRWRVGDNSKAPYYDPGVNVGTAELHAPRPARMGLWDWYAMAIKLDPTWVQTSWCGFIEPMFPRYTSPPFQITTAFKDVYGNRCGSYASRDGTPPWFWLQTYVGTVGSLVLTYYPLFHAQLGHWYEFVFGVKWALDNTGAFKVYTREPGVEANFTLRTSGTNVVTYQTDGGPIPSGMSDITFLYFGTNPANGWPTPIPTNICYTDGMRRYADEATALQAFG